ncbi:MAG TPA: hypothetical protein VM432_11470 [Bdellovibrionales bacterium]|nr:hypothetical protein [Bdellovibrionales bacterium]
MKKILILAISCLSLLIGEFALAGVCKLPGFPKINQQGNILFLTWTIGNERSVFSNQFDPNQEDEDYAEWVHAGFPAERAYDPLLSLKHHRSLMANVNWDPKKKESILRQLDLMIDIARLQIRKTTCLETELFRRHLAFVSPDHYSEFGAEVLMSKDGKRLKIHFISERGSGGVARMNLLQEAIAADLKVGWKRWLHIHNHPFDFTNPYGDFAPIGPSDPDLKVYVEHRYEAAIVTDGIHSFEMAPRHYQEMYALQP